MKELLIREQYPEERALVLSAWKRDLWAKREGVLSVMRAIEWWALTNYVIDQVTYPSVEVWMACYVGEPKTPLCWIAVRDGHALHTYARRSLLREPELAATLEKELRSFAPLGDLAFDPFAELKRKT